MSRYKDKEILKQRQETAYRYFIDKGYSPAQASGIVGNLMHESNLDPGVTSTFKGEGSFGIAQWNPSAAAGNRFGKLKEFAKQRGASYSDFNVQLEFINHELDTFAGFGKNKLKNARTVREASDIFADHYERPNAKYAHKDKRWNYGSNILTMFNDDRIFIKDDNGEVSAIDEPYASEDDKLKSSAIKREFYRETFGLPMNKQTGINDPAPVAKAKESIDASKNEVEFKNNLIEALKNLNTTETVNQTPQRQVNQEPQQFDVQPNEFYADVLPEFKHGGTHDPREQTIKSSESTATKQPLLKPKILPNSENKKFNYVQPEDVDKIDILPVQLDEVVINVSREKLRREKESQEAVDLKTNYVDRRFEEGINTNFSNKDEVRKVQEFLKEKGYNLDPNKRFKNEGVDGIAGKVTMAAIEEYNKNIKNEPVYKSQKDNPSNENNIFQVKDERGYLGKCTETQCSEYVQNEIFRNVAEREFGMTDADRAKWNKEIGITGNAWDLGNNIIDAGGRQVSISEIRPGDIVGINSGSGGSNAEKARRALKSRDAFYTHSGIVDEVNPDGSYYVLHNWHKLNIMNNKWEGREYRTLVRPQDGNVLPGFPGDGIQEVFRPNYKGERKDKVVARDDVKLVKRGDGYTKPESELFTIPINNVEVKNKFMNNYNLDETEFYSIGKAALGIMGQETNFGTDLLFDSGAKKTGAYLSKLIGEKQNEVSLGPGSMKLDTNFNGAELSLFGVNSRNIENPANATIVTMQKLAKDYKYFKRKGFDSKESIYRAIQKYNSWGSRSVAGKTREDWAKDHDLDYSNKVINFASDFQVLTGDGKLANTLLDDISKEDNVVKWASRVKEKGQESQWDQIKNYIDSIPGVLSIGQ